MNDSPRLLLLTSHPPGGHGVGRIYVRSLCNLMAERTVALAALLSPGEHWTPETDPAIAACHQLSRRYESVYRPWRGVIGEVLA